MMHKVIVHRANRTYEAYIKPNGLLADAIGYLLQCARDDEPRRATVYDATGAEVAWTRDDGALGYGIYDADGKPLDLLRHRMQTAAQVGLGEETHIYLRVPGENE